MGSYAQLMSDKGEMYRLVTEHASDAQNSGKSQAHSAKLKRSSDELGSDTNALLDEPKIEAEEVESESETDEEHTQPRWDSYKSEFIIDFSPSCSLHFSTFI